VSGELVALVGLLGAVAGAVITVLGTWWNSVRRERRREISDLITAVALVATELTENAARIARNPHSRTLPIGDWETYKREMAALGRRDHELWIRVTEAYGRTYDARTDPSVEPPTPEELRALSQELLRQRDGLQRELESLAGPRRTRV
jgi:HAMP domain-containing protein